MGRSAYSIGKFSRAGDLSQRHSRFCDGILFKLIGRTGKNPSVYNSYKSIKDIHRRFNEQIAGAAVLDRITPDRRCCRYRRSVPKPIFGTDTAALQRANLDTVNGQPRNHGLIKHMCGIVASPGRILRAKILSNCMYVYPIELRSVLYMFASSHLDTMTQVEMNQLSSFINAAIGQGGGRMLDYLMAKQHSNFIATEYGAIWQRILTFVWKDHPSLMDVGPLRLNGHGMSEYINGKNLESSYP